jgi:tetratricopeptide (TPR) repeat protein
MNNEHNPIAQLITTIQQKWASEITPFHYQFIRWLINEEEGKLYEGFVHIESTPHGKLPEIFVAFLTPLKSRYSFSHDLLETWLQAFDEDKKTFNKLEADGNAFKWDAAPYRKKLASDEDITEQLLLEMIASFHKALKVPNRKLTVVLLPNSVSSINEYQQWLHNVLKAGVPDGIQFCMFDYVEDRYLDDFFQKLDEGIGKTVLLKLNLAEAESKLMQTGDPNSPQVQLRKYILKMGEAAGAKDLGKLMYWGNEFIDAMTKSKIKSLMASAYIAFAGMLFNFKEYAEIERLLQKGLKIAQAGSASGDVACNALVIQFYSFIASNYQLNKKYKLSIEWFCKKAEVSIKSKLFPFAISAYRQAASIAEKHDFYQYQNILTKGFSVGESLGKEELIYTDYAFVGLDYFQFVERKGEMDICTRIDNKMKEVFGKAWKEDTKDKLNAANKKYVYN